MSHEIVIHAHVLFVHCPHCGQEVTGWVSDPRGAPDADCDECGEKFAIPADARVVLT